MICPECYCRHSEFACQRSEEDPELSASDKFDVLFEQWKMGVKHIDDFEKGQQELVEAIDSVFNSVIKDKKMLAQLDWEVEIYPSRSRLIAQIKDNAVQEFLDKLEWEGGRYHWHHAIMLGDLHIFLDDGVMSISFENVDEMVEFCEEQGIEPNVTTLNAQRSKAELEASRLTQIIERLCDDK